MSLIQAILLGIVEGLTEFLPISSTFHLIFTSRILGIPNTEFLKMFEVFIQTGAILPVLLILGKEYWQDRELSKKVLFSFFPTAVVGLILHRLIKDVFFESYGVMMGVFIAVGVAFILVERWLNKSVSSQTLTTIKNMTYSQAALIGLIQALAVLPGVSRAGAVIVGMLLLRFSRVEATKYSFLLAVPTILAASALDVVKTRGLLMTVGSQNLLLMMVGFGCAFVSGLVVTKWFLGFVKGHSLNVFGWYRIVIGVVLMSIFLR